MASVPWGAPGGGSYLEMSSMSSTKESSFSRVEFTVDRGTEDSDGGTDAPPPADADAGGAEDEAGAFMPE